MSAGEAEHLYPAPELRRPLQIPLGLTRSGIPNSAKTAGCQRREGAGPGGQLHVLRSLRAENSPYLSPIALIYHLSTSAYHSSLPAPRRRSCFTGVWGFLLLFWDGGWKAQETWLWLSLPSMCTPTHFIMKTALKKQWWRENRRKEKLQRHRKKMKFTGEILRMGNHAG